MCTRGAEERPTAYSPLQAPQAHPNAPPIQRAALRKPDYSRQTTLKEVGEKGQAKLQASKVLVIGCGGLGVPVILILAGAGVGTLGLVDGDKLEPSNLHRQTMFALADVGEYKAILAADRVRALNPETEVRAYTFRLTADNASELVSEYDLVIDCTDNFSTMFLLNDVLRTSAQASHFLQRLPVRRPASGRAAGSRWRLPALCMA